MLFSLITLGLISYILHAIYKRFISEPSSKYWKKYGIRQVDATLAASTWDIFMGRKDISERDEYAYNLLSSTGEKYCGLTENFDKVLLVKDVEIVKKILIKNFDHFPIRRDFSGWARDDNIFRKMMPSERGDEWKSLRHTLTPAFSAAKIRKMMEFFNIVGKEWSTSLKVKAKANSSGTLEIDAIKCVTTYTVDVIAASVFGMRAGTIENPNSEFSTQAMKFMNPNTYKLIVGLLFPNICRLFGIEVIDMGAMGYFENILKQGLQQRLKSSQRENDFIQLLIDAQKGELKSSGEEQPNDFEKDAQVHSTRKEIKLTDEVLNAQSMLFFLAGFSGTTNTITFSLYVLAAHPDIQEKLKREVDGIVKEGGDFDYDELAQLQYMDMFVNEVLRMFSPLLRLERICESDYKDPETGLFVPKGTLVAIPVKSIHYDKQYYPNADRFDPEGNWSSETKRNRSPYVFLPFGSGPRNCIGMRFAMIETKAAVAHIVYNFLIEPTYKTPLPVTPHINALQSSPPKGLELKLTPRN